MTRHKTRLLPGAAVLLLCLTPLVTGRDATATSHQLGSRKDGSSELAEAPLLAAAADEKLSRLKVGTKDAPVDGLDGKPHAGPFVDSTEATPLSDSAKNAIVGDTSRTSVTAGTAAEDGVMNDPHRVPPKQGTTGTEGGVTEKDRDRRIQEFSTGEKKVNIPDQPKSSMVDHATTTTTTELPSKATRAPSDSSDGAVKGYTGLEKPRDLPEKPHIVPFSEAESKRKEASIDSFLSKHDDDHDHDHSHKEDDDDDDDDDDEDEEDGAHDIIPWDSLVGSFSSIAATEIGDKTFIVAALMAMRYSRIQVFSAAFSALFVMTILSGLVGHAMGAIISKKWSALVAALLFLVFGAKSLREGFEMSPDQGVSDEIREVEAELEEKEVDMARNANGHKRTSSISPYALEAGRRSRSDSRMTAPHGGYSNSDSRSPSPSQASVKTTVNGVKNLLSLLLSPAWVETFSMTFVGELGDRSQIATVAMAAGQEYFWVMVGASLGHFVCTGVAVLGGSVLAGRVSLRKVTLVGGAIFIGFGLFTLIEAARYWT